MSYGLAQFGFAAIDSFNKTTEDNRLKAEAKADKLYDRGRQAVSDKREQEKFDVAMAGDKITLEGQKMDGDSKKNAFDYEATYNKSAWLEKAGDYNAAADTIVRAANQNSNIPFKVDIERDETGKVIQRTDEQGNPYYYQTIYDKETGVAVGQPTAISYDQLKDSFNQLNNAKSIDAANAAYQQKLADEMAKDKRELTLYGGKANVDQSKYAANKGVDHGYNVSLEGIKFGHQVQRDEKLQGYAIDKQNNQAGHAQALAALNGELAAGRIDQATYNRQAEYLYKTAVDQGQVPGVTIGRDRASQVRGIIGSLTGTESSGNSAAFRTNTNGKSYGGLIQMGDDRLKDYATKTGSRPISASQFKNLPATQQRAINEWHINDLIGAAQATGAVGKVINGVPVTLGGLVAVAHLGGKGGMNKFVQTNGRYNPKDQLGTSLTDYLVKHRSSTAGGVQTTLNQPLKPKLPKGAAKSSTKQAESGQGITTPRDYNANIDKGVSKALKDVKALGVKPDGKTGATFARAAGKLKGIGQAKDYQEFLDLYGEAVDMVVTTIPEPRGKDKKLSKADRTALGEQIILTMVGASSLSNFKSMVFTVNPNTVGNRGTGNSSNTGGGLMLPGQQPSRATPAQGAQSGKLASLYARGLPAVKTDPKAQENMNYLGNLNDSIDW